MSRPSVLGLATRLLLALCLLLSGGVARAEEPGASDRDRAVQLFERATGLESASRWPEAARLLEQAIALKETPGLRYHLAYCLEQEGKLAAALESYQRAAELLETQPAPDVKELVGPALEALSARVPLLRLEMPEKVAGVVVEVDGGPRQLDQPLRIDPGPHALRVIAPGRAAFEARVDLAEGERRSIAIVLPRESKRPERPRVVPPRPPPRPRRAARDAVVVSEGVVTIVALAVGLMFTAKRSTAYERAEDADQFISEQAGGDDACSRRDEAFTQVCAELRAALDDLDRARSVQVPAFVAAAAGAVATVTTLLVWRPRPRTEPVRSIQMSQLELRAAPGRGLALSVSGSF